MTIDKQAFRDASRARPTFAAAQGAEALGRQGLGPVLDWVALVANPTNAVYRAVCRDASYIIKIKHRPFFSLDVESKMTALLRDTTDLPVPELCVCCDETDSFGHPYLISNLLPGTQGRDFFEAEGTGDEARRRLFRAFGAVVAAIHRQPLPDGLLPDQGAAPWQEDIRQKLLEHEGLIAALPAECRAKLPVIKDLLDKIDITPDPTPQGLLWGDAALHNLQVDGDGRILGVLDFENALTGDLLKDQLHIASEFTRGPKELYGQDHYAREFWSGYADAGGERIEPDPTYLRVRRATMRAGLGWFWEVLGVLHPKTPLWLDELENELRGLLD